MEMKKSIEKRRMGVILTLLSLGLMVFIFEYGKIEQWNTVLQISGILSIIVFIASLIPTFFKTGLWKFIHKPLKELDEREIVLTSKSLRYAYSIFTVVVLSLLLILAITTLQIDVVLVAALILFAHLLPASVIAWTEKVI